MTIAPDGRTVIAPTAQQAAEASGPGNFVFKIGERAVGRWRWTTAGS